MMFLRSAILTLALSAAVAPAARAETPNGNLAAAGRDFAQRVCGACHVVTPQREPLLSPPAPSFVVLAQRPLLTEQALREFLGSNHGTMGPRDAMPNPRLVDYQIDEIVAFMMSLKAAK